MGHAQQWALEHLGKAIQPTCKGKTVVDHFTCRQNLRSISKMCIWISICFQIMQCCVPGFASQANRPRYRFGVSLSRWIGFKVVRFQTRRGMLEIATNTLKTSMQLFFSSLRWVSKRFAGPRAFHVKIVLWGELRQEKYSGSKNFPSLSFRPERMMSLQPSMASVSIVRGGSSKLDGSRTCQSCSRGQASVNMSRHIRDSPGRASAMPVALASNALWMCRL